MLLEELARKGAEAPHIWLLRTVRDTAVRITLRNVYNAWHLGVTVTAHSTAVSNDLLVIHTYM